MVPAATAGIVYRVLEPRAPTTTSGYPRGEPHGGRALGWDGMGWLGGVPHRLSDSTVDSRSLGCGFRHGPLHLPLARAHSLGPNAAIVACHLVLVQTDETRWIYLPSAQPPISLLPLDRAVFPPEPQSLGSKARQAQPGQQWYPAGPPVSLPATGEYPAPPACRRSPPTPLPFHYLPRPWPRKPSLPPREGHDVSVPRGSAKNPNYKGLCEATLLTEAHRGPSRGGLDGGSCTLATCVL